MPELVRPDPAYETSFRAAMAEFAAEGRGAPDDNTMVGHDLREGAWDGPDGFAGYVAAVLAERERPAQPGWVRCSTFWWVEGEEYLARLAIRHELTPHLREVGGHIGYDVRPTARRRGHATAMLAAARPVAHDLGIDPALITCDHDNVGSRRVIATNGGVLEGRRGDKLRFWVPTGQR